MVRYWFKPKTFGYGATPVTWEGWALTFAHALLVIGCIVLMVLNEDNLPLIAVCLAIVLISTIGSVWLTRAKTEGEWVWRWGVNK